MRHRLIFLSVVLVSIISIRAVGDKPADPKSIAKAFAQALIDGDEATLMRAKGAPDPIRLRKTLEGWKIYKLPAAMMNSRGQVVAMRRALESVAAGISKGEYKTAQESYAVRTMAHDIAIHSTTQP